MTPLTPGLPLVIGLAPLTNRGNPGKPCLLSRSTFSNCRRSRVGLGLEVLGARERLSSSDLVCVTIKKLPLCHRAASLARSACQRAKTHTASLATIRAKRLRGSSRSHSALV